MDKKEYLKQYRQRNKEKIKKYNYEYNIKNNEKILERKRQWYQNKKIKMKEGKENV